LNKPTPSRQGISFDFSAVSKSFIWLQLGTNPGELSCLLGEQDEISKVVISKIEIFFI
jgi:hypothetical protein